MPRHGDQRSRAARDGIVRRNIHHHRNLARADHLNDLQHRFHISAGRVQLNDEHFRIALLGGFNPAFEIFQHRRHDRAIRSHHNGKRFIALRKHRLDDRKRDQKQKGNTGKFHDCFQSV